MRGACPSVRPTWGYAITSFSARLLDHMKSLGAKYTEEERESFMAVWRYTGHVMGIPSSILFQRRERCPTLEADRRHVRTPALAEESVVMANALVNSAPLVIDITDPVERRTLAGYVFKVSRALIGNKMADQLMYPPDSSFGTLFIFRLQERYKHLLAKLGRKRMENSNFTQVYVAAGGLGA